ncbi:MAG: hypothetical protein II260_08790 [Muribaculaceae bacterium]|nr:hypothetical protein [Muribaculaceae bacterium]
MTDKDDSCPYPSSDEKYFSDDDLNELISTAPQELGAGQHFIIQPTASIESSHFGATYVKIHYSRTGTNGNVNVNICYFFNYDCAVKAIFSYRESEKDLWEQNLLRALNSFAWENPYISQTYSQDKETISHVKKHISNNSRSRLIDVMIGMLLMGVIMSITYAVKSNNKKKLRTLIKERIAITNDLIQNKKVVSATDQLNETKRIENRKIPELHDQITEMEIQLESLKSEVAQNIETQINAIKREFAEDPSILGKTNTTELLKDKEIPKKEKEKIDSEFKALEEEYKKGIIPKQQKARVNYSIDQCTRNGYYAFYTAPSSKTEIIPYRRRKVELRGYTEQNFEIKLRNSLKESTRYKVLGDVSIQTSESSHPFEPDIAIIETSGNLGVRIDIEIDEPYGGYDKIPIHYLGCGDEFRDRNLANLGWLVVRFSEKQIFQEPDNCIYYLQQLLSLIDPYFTISQQGKKPTPDKCWTEVEAKIMAIKKFREDLLNHEFGRMMKDTRVVATQLTELEKFVINNAKPIYIPTAIPHNIDKTNTEFSQDSLLAFEPSEHIYLYDGRIQLTAVSNIINQFFIPFDSIGHSKRVALKDGILQCKVLEDWDCKGLESRMVGSFLHAQIEAFFSNNPICMKTHFNYDGDYVQVSKEVAIDEEISYFKNFLRDNPITPFRTEWQIFDLELRIAGTIDLLCRNGCHFDIYDWKRSRKALPNETIWKNGINGLEHVPDISFFHYALQQNIYKYILEKNYGITIENMYIVVLHPMYGNYKKLKIPNMSKEITIIKSHIVKSLKCRTNGRQN